MFWVFGIYNLFEKGLINAIRTAIKPGETGDAVLVGLGFLVVIVSSYLLGSINWAIVISKFFYNDDVRRHGSGNAGTTNVLRTYGKRAAVFTFVGDGLKGVLSIVIACALFGFPMTAYVQNNVLVYDVYYMQLITAAYLAALFAVIGHIFPIFSKFHGGKGFATFLFCTLALNPIIGLMLVCIMLILLAGSHFVSLGSIVTAAFYPILLHSFDSINPIRPYGINVLFAFLLAAFVTWSHRTNIKRLLNHTERKTYFFKKPDETKNEKENV